MTFATALIAATLGGCATADRVQELEEKIATLEGRVEELEARPVAAGAASAEDEKAAGKLLEEISGLVKEGKMTDAKGKASQLSKKASVQVCSIRVRLVSEPTIRRSWLPV